MPKITDITPQKRKTDMYNIYLDGKYAFSASDEELARRNLDVGSQVDAPDLEEIHYQKHFTQVLQKIYNYLSHRLRTEKEIKDKIDYYLFKVDEFVDKERVKSEVIARLEQAKLIDDEKFAKLFIEEKLTAKRPWGPYKIKKWLAGKGLASKVLDKEIEKIDSETQYAGAQEVAQDQARKLGETNKYKRKKKLYDFLLRRGFKSEVIYRVLDEIE